MAASPTRAGISIRSALSQHNEGWAVGESGTVLRLSGGAWSVVSGISTTESLTSIALSRHQRRLGRGQQRHDPAPGGWGLVDRRQPVVRAVSPRVVHVSSGAYAPGPSVGIITSAARFCCGCGPARAPGSGTTGLMRGGEPWQVRQFALAPGQTGEGIGYALGWNGNYDSPQYNRPLMVRMGGGAWIQSADWPATQTVNALALTDANTGWAVGNGGAIWRFSGGAWQQVTPSPTAKHLSRRDYLRRHRLGGRTGRDDPAAERRDLEPGGQCGD